MKKMILALLAVSAFTASAHASYILECKTLGGKDIQIQYAYNGTTTVLETVSIAGQNVATSNFSFTRSGLRLTLANGITIAENNGAVTQTSGTGEAKAITCKRSNTDAPKVTPADF